MKTQNKISKIKNLIKQTKTQSQNKTKQNNQNKNNNKKGHTTSLNNTD